MILVANDHVFLPTVLCIEFFTKVTDLLKRRMRVGLFHDLGFCDTTFDEVALRNFCFGLFARSAGTGHDQSGYCLLREKIVAHLYALTEGGARTIAESM